MIICRLFQKWVSWNAATSPGLPGWARRHEQICPTCRAYHARVIATESELSRGAESERRQPPPFLQGKIMSSVRREEITSSQPTAPRTAWAIAVGTACVVIAGVLVMRQPVTQPVKILATRPAVPIVLSLNLPTATQMDGWTKSLDAPLEKEMQLVLDDAKTAMNSLRQSLLPENNTGTSPRQN